MSKPTPGPWVVWPEWITEQGEYHESEVVTREANPRTIATIRVGLEGTAANASLIAAAPELLDACKDTLCDLRVARILSEKGFEQAIARLEAAIAKAEGRSCE